MEYELGEKIEAKGLRLREEIKIFYKGRDKEKRLVFIEASEIKKNIITKITEWSIPENNILTLNGDKKIEITGGRIGINSLFKWEPNYQEDLNIILNKK